MVGRVGVGVVEKVQSQSSRQGALNLAKGGVLLCCFPCSVRPVAPFVRGDFPGRLDEEEDRNPNRIRSDEESPSYHQSSQQCPFNSGSREQNGGRKRDIE